MGHGRLRLIAARLNALGVVSLPDLRGRALSLRRSEKTGMAWEQQAKLTKADFAAARRDEKKTRVLLDESVEVAAAVLLRGGRLNVVHASEVGLAGRSDEEVFAYAWREDRVLVTHDQDFMNNRTFPPQRNPGVVLLPGEAGATSALPEILSWVARTIGQSRDLWWGTKTVFAGDGSWVTSTFERTEGRIVSTRYRLRGGRLEIWVD